MKQEKIEEQLSSMLPNRTQAPSLEHSSETFKNSISEQAASIKAKRDASELARIKYMEKTRLASAKAKLEERRTAAKELGLDQETADAAYSKKELERIAEHERNLRTIDAIEANNATPLDLKSNNAGPNSIKATDILKLQGTSRPEIARLLTSLNINLSVQLTKQDTANLLACLLTCNESQLQALMSNKKVPVVIKTVIKRLIEDMKLGNIDTVEKLWDRVFGKGQMQLNLPESQQLQTGILPNVPMSREAYIIIRESLMK